MCFQNLCDLAFVSKEGSLISATLLILTFTKEMNNKALSQQHLPTPEHAAPATISGPHSTIQLLKVPTVGQPDAGGKVFLETLHILCKTKQDLSR